MDKLAKLKLLSLDDSDFLEISECLSHVYTDDARVIKTAIKNLDIKLFKKQFNILKENLVKDCFDGTITKIAGEVEAVYTYINDVEMANILYQAYKSVYGKEPNMQLLGLLWSQAAFETGQKDGKFRLRNNNFGGITAGNFDKWNGTGWERSGKPFVRSKTNPNMKFKSFSTPVEGAIEFIKTLGNLYPESMKWKATGLIADDVLYMATKNYFGSEKISRYGGGMDTYMRRFMSTVYPSFKGKISETPEPPPGKISMEHKEYGDNPYLKGKTNSVIPRVKLKSEQWAYNYDGKQPVVGDAKITKDLKPSGPMENPDIFDMSVFDDGQPGAAAETQVKEPQSDSLYSGHYDSLMKALLASGPVERLVKKSLLKDKLGTNSLLVKVISDEPDFVQYRFIRALASELRRDLDAEVSIHKGFEIECDAYGSYDLVERSIKAISYGVKDSFAKFGKFDILVCGGKSGGEILEENKDSNRMFNLKFAGMIHG